ncbi:hypothetical protein IFT93_22425 [Erwinia persicina]|uniref:Helicase n=1 Tax=Erwinia persicina TaxID=55211 RepID=A0ABR8ZZF7_9GAMM|nr:hypothetical protein [Erwinia persicina]MBD8170100.1 hypothetical protein [Erwinia persicina]MBD8212246.1 hypothetical protein [Erwinia persicina]
MGSIPACRYETEFTQRLQQTFADALFTLLENAAAKAEEAFYSGDATDPQTLLAELRHQPAVLSSLAVMCLQSVTLRQLLQSRDPSLLRLLLQTLLERVKPEEVVLPASYYHRVTASRLALAALGYLLNDRQGCCWLSEHYPEVSQFYSWSKAAFSGEIAVELIIQLLTPEVLPATVTDRWIKPLWQHKAVRSLVLLHAGRGTTEEIEFRLNRPIAEEEHCEPHVGSQFISRKHKTLGTALQNVRNAGVILLWPLFTQLFSLLALTEDQKFVSEQTRWLAALSLDHLAGGNAELVTEGLTINKLLCGLSAESSLPEGCLLSTEQQRLTDEWLTAVCQQLPGGKKLDIADIRALFLQRPGEILTDTQPPRIAVQPEAFDYLLRDWPWPLTLATFPWLDQPLTIVWPLNGLTG